MMSARNLVSVSWCERFIGVYRLTNFWHLNLIWIWTRLLHQAEQSLLPTATRKNSKQKDNNKKFPQSFVSCTHNFAWPICPPLLVIVVWLTRRHLEGGHSLFFRVDLFCAFPCVPVLRALHSISALHCCAVCMSMNCTSLLCTSLNCTSLSYMSMLCLSLLCTSLNCTLEDQISSILQAMVIATDFL